MPNFADPKLNSIGWIAVGDASRQLFAGKTFRPEKVLAVATASGLYQFSVKDLLETTFSNFSGEKVISSALAEVLGTGVGLALLDRTGLISKKSAEITGEGNGNGGADATFQNNFMLATSDVIISRVLQFGFTQLPPMTPTNTNNNTNSTIATT